jgi:hypothetical protein
MYVTATIFSWVILFSLHGGILSLVVAKNEFSTKFILIKLKLDTSIASMNYFLIRKLLLSHTFERNSILFLEVEVSNGNACHNKIH